MLSFKPTFSLSSITLNKRLFSSSSLSAIRVVSSACLRLFVFVPELLISACDSSGPAFLMMLNSVQKSNRQGDTIEPSHSSFPIFKPSVVPCPVLIVAFALHTGVSGGSSGGLVFPCMTTRHDNLCLNTHSLPGCGVVTAAQETEAGTRQEPRTQACLSECSAAWRGPGSYSPDGPRTCFLPSTEGDGSTWPGGPGGLEHSGLVSWLPRCC